MTLGDGETLVGGMTLGGGETLGGGMTLGGGETLGGGMTLGGGVTTTLPKINSLKLNKRTMLRRRYLYMFLT